MSRDDLEFLIVNYRRLSPGGRSLLERLIAGRAQALRAAYLRKLWRRFVNWRQTRSALAQLNALDDAALKDIGLHRSSIEAAVRTCREPLPQPRRPRSFQQKPHLYLQRTG